MVLRDVLKFHNKIIVNESEIIMQDTLYQRGKDLELSLIKSERGSWPLVEITDKKGNRRKVRVNPDKLKQAEANKVRKLVSSSESGKTKAATDKELVERISQGDERAQAELYSKYRGDAKKIINTFVRDSDIADDLTSDTFIKVFKNIDSYKALSDTFPFKSWFTRVASNTARDYLRSAANAFKQNAISEEAKKVNFHSMADSSTPQQELESKQLASTIKSAIDTLPKEYASTIESFYFKGLSIKEIAKEEGVSESGIKQRLARAKEQLKTKLSPDLYKAVNLQFTAIEMIEPID